MLPLNLHHHQACARDGVHPVTEGNIRVFSRQIRIKSGLQPSAQDGKRVQRCDRGRVQFMDAAEDRLKYEMGQ